MTQEKQPSTWRIVELQEIATFVSGGTPSRKNPDYFTGTVPWLTGYDLAEDTVTFVEQGREYITQEAIRKSAANLVPPQTVLLTTRVTVAKVGIALKSLCFSQDVTGIVINNLEVIDPVYIAHYLLAVKEMLLSRNRGTTIQGIIRRDLERFQVPLPPLSEQRRIVEILRQADDLRRLRRQADEQMQDLPAALFYEMFGDPISNERGWEKRRVKEICDLVRGSSPRPQGDPRYYGGPIPRLMVADLTRDGIYVTPKIDSLTLEGAKKSRPMKSGSVVMAVSGAPGLPAILNTDACIHDGFVGFRKLVSSVKPEYFAGVLLAFKALSEAQAIGVTFQNLKTGQINRWQIPIPPFELQEEYTSRFKRTLNLQKDQEVMECLERPLWAIHLQKVNSAFCL